MHGIELVLPNINNTITLHRDYCQCPNASIGARTKQGQFDLSQSDSEWNISTVSLSIQENAGFYSMPIETLSENQPITVS